MKKFLIFIFISLFTMAAYAAWNDPFGGPSGGGGGLTTPLSVGQGGTGTNSGSITGTGPLAFAAGGSSQNVTLTPSGSGYTILNGNVGIGTTTPDNAIQVAKLINFDNTLANTWLGYQAGNFNTTGTYNIAIGYASLYSNTTGAYNTAIGYASLYSNTTGTYNTANSHASLYFNTTGAYNTANGNASLYSNTTGAYNTADGDYSLYSNTTNVATLGAITGGSLYTPGTYTGVVMTLSSGSSAATYPTATIVVSAGGAVSSVTITSPGAGFQDTTTVLTAPAASIGGTGSGFSVPVASLNKGYGNTALGYQAGRYIANGSTANLTATNSLYLGYNAYPLADNDTNETVIGPSAVGNGSNTTTLGNASVTKTIIPAGSVGIGTTSPSQILHVLGNIEHSTAAANSGGGLIQKVVEAVSPALSGPTGTITLGIPAGDRIKAIQLRVDTLITIDAVGTTWSAVYINTPSTAICTGQPLTKNTVFNAIHPAYEITTGTVAITIAANAGNFTAGVVRAIVYYDELDPMSAAQ
jgi:hypothetical protein